MGRLQCMSGGESKAAVAHHPCESAQLLVPVGRSDPSPHAARVPAVYATTGPGLELRNVIRRGAAKTIPTKLRQSQSQVQDSATQHVQCSNADAASLQSPRVQSEVHAISRHANRHRQAAQAEDKIAEERMGPCQLTRA